MSKWCWTAPWFFADGVHIYKWSIGGSIFEEKEAARIHFNSQSSNHENGIAACADMNLKDMGFLFHPQLAIRIPGTETFSDQDATDMKGFCRVYLTDTVGHLANSQGYSGRLEGRKLNLLAGFRTVPELAYRVVDAPEWHTTAKKKIMENDLPADHYGVILTFTKGLHNASYNKGKVPWTPDDLSKALNAYSLPHVTLADVLKEHKINKSTINRASSTIVGWEKGRDNSAEIHAYIMKKYCHTAPCATITNQAASTSSSSLQHQEEEQEEEIILEESEKEKKLKQEVIELKHEITRLNNLIEKLEIENASFSCVCDGCF